MSEICWYMQCPRRPLYTCIYRREARPCRDMVYRDDWCADVVQRIKIQLAKKRASAETMTRTCDSCGRTWTGSGKHLYGRYRSPIERHMRACLTRTPAYRRRKQRQDECAWVHKPSKVFVVVNDPEHPGLRGD